MSKRWFILVLSILMLSGCRSSIVDDPSTQIQYSVAEPSLVKIEIENNYNTVIETPVNGYQSAGVHSVVINASKWVEGVYYYTLECKGVNSDFYYKSTKTMLLIK